MATAKAPKQRKYSYKRELKKVDPGIDNKVETEYRFSNGRKFERYVGRGS